MVLRGFFFLLYHILEVDTKFRPKNTSIFKLHVRNNGLADTYLFGRLFRVIYRTFLRKIYAHVERLNYERFNLTLTGDYRFELNSVGPSYE